MKTKKKGLHVFRRPIYPPKSSEDQKKGQRVLRCPVSTVSLTADIYISLYFSVSGGGGHDPRAPPPGYAPEICYQICLGLLNLKTDVLSVTSLSSAQLSSSTLCLLKFVISVQVNLF